MPKNTGKKAQETKPSTSSSNIRIKIGNVKLNNVDLNNIIKQSEDLQKNPEFMKSLNEFALEKSKEIVNAAEISSQIEKTPTPSPPKKEASKASKAAKEEEVTVQMNIKKVAANANAKAPQNKAKVQQKVAPTPPPTQQQQQQQNSKASNPKNRQKALLNPSGTDTAYYQKALDVLDSSEFDSRLGCVQPKNTTRFELTNAFFQKPKVIAEQLLKGELTCTFQFTIDVYFGLTGCVRRCVYFYLGQNTFETILHSFRHKYCESEVVQWFYMNFSGEMMEITDTLSLNHMLITYGAAPKGAYETVPEVGKVLCVPRCTLTDTRVFERESDLILGMMSAECETFTKKAAQYAEYLPIHLAPDRRYAELFEQLLEPTSGKFDENHPYNGYYNIAELVMYCQRKLELGELFNDPRSNMVTTNDLILLLVNSFKQPFRNMSPADSLKLEYDLILKTLRKSKHQTVGAYEYIAMLLKENVRKISRNY